MSHGKNSYIEPSTPLLRTSYESLQQSGAPSVDPKWQDP